MTKTNLDFLCEDLQFLGFGEGLRTNLEKGMESGADSFELYFAQGFGSDTVQAIVFIERPDTGGFYFFTKYKLKLDEREHYFTVFRGKGITLKEGYNLLSGRPVYKQLQSRNGQKYNTWMQLDTETPESGGFKVCKYYESHGFELAKTLSELPIETPSSNWDMAMMVRSLERGNLQAAFLKENGENIKVLLEADPKNKIIIIHRIPELKEKGKVELKKEGGNDTFKESVNKEKDDIEKPRGKKKSRT